jgi:hypothetical protein
VVAQIKVDTKEHVMKTTHLARITPAVVLTLACAPDLQAGFTPQPSLVYETTVAGFYLASGRQMAVDPQGNAYVAGRAIDAENDIVVVKLDAEGDVMWTNHIRGNDHDYATGIVLDENDDLYIAGWTDSSDFPTVGALQTTLTGFRDAFVMKLAGQDGTILYSTYLGGDYTAVPPSRRTFRPSTRSRGGRSATPMPTPTRSSRSCQRMAARSSTALIWAAPRTTAPSPSGLTPTATWSLPGTPTRSIFRR